MLTPTITAVLVFLEPPGGGGKVLLAQVPFESLSYPLGQSHTLAAMHSGISWHIE